MNTRTTTMLAAILLSVGMAHGLDYHVTRPAEHLTNQSAHLKMIAQDAAIRDYMSGLDEETLSQFNSHFGKKSLEKYATHQKRKKTGFLATKTGKIIVGGCVVGGAALCLFLISKNRDNTATIERLTAALATATANTNTAQNKLESVRTELERIRTELRHITKQNSELSGEVHSAVWSKNIFRNKLDVANASIRRLGNKLDASINQRNNAVMERDAAVGASDAYLARARRAEGASAAFVSPFTGA